MKRTVNVVIMIVEAKVIKEKRRPRKLKFGSDFERCKIPWNNEDEIEEQLL